MEMNGMHVLRTIALVMQSPEIRRSRFTVTRNPAILGTCFAFRRSTIFLTAHHVIREHDPETLAISFISAQGLRPVEQVHAHPTADLAILEAPDFKSGPIDPLDLPTDDNIHLGETFSAFGFPSDLVFGQAGGSVHRMLMGHYQRFFDFQSNLWNYRYVAGEMNMPSPKGMSGAPLIRPQSPQFVTGLAAESVNIQAWPRLVSETTVNGHTESVTETEMIQYGVAVLLGPLRGWINLQVSAL